MFKVSLSSSLLLATCMLFSSCATIVSKTSYPVSIYSEPRGARVSITDKKGKEIYKGTTPAVVRLKSGAGYFSRAEYQVRLSADGYEERLIQVTFKLNGWYFGNLLIGGLIGMLIVDPASGAMWKIDNYSDDINEVLKASNSSTGPSLKVLNINDLPKDLREGLTRIN